MIILIKDDQNMKKEMRHHYPIETWYEETYRQKRKYILQKTLTEVQLMLCDHLGRYVDA